MTVKQPTARPTNKLTAAALAALFVSVSNLVVQNLYPEWHNPGVFITLGPVMVGLFGYVIEDAPNT